MSKRTLLVETKTLEPDHILGLREQFASAETEGARIVWDHGFGFGVASISMTIDFPDGSSAVEIVSLSDLMQKWAKEVLNEQAVKEG